MGDRPGEPAWTVAEASRFFADGLLPIDPGCLRDIVRALRRNSAGAHWSPVGERLPADRPQGGRGEATYPIAEFMRLQAGLAPWLVRAEPPAADARPGAPGPSPP